jgi:2-oxo-3-hexenedioate decarboxylase
MTTLDTEAVAEKVLAALDTRSQVAPFTDQDPAFSPEQAYAVTAHLRQRRTARGEKHAGRKIGFTNRGIWQQYNVTAPIWGDMFDTTVRDLSQSKTLSLASFVEPRIEPEIVFKLSRDVKPDADEAELLASTAWIAHGFEIVQSIYPDWRFHGADVIAAGGVHGVLLLGPQHPVAALGPDVKDALVDFSVTLSCNGKVMDRGKGVNVLGGPLSALRHLVEVLGRDRFNPPLRAGEVVTTGTLTAAFPIAPGEKWSTSIEGIALEGIAVEFT